MPNENHKILIVEDDSDFRETVRLALESEGYQVEAAINGRNALDLLDEHRNVSLILLDMMMPQMNGREFLDSISTNDIYNKIPVIFVAADLAHDLRAGSVAYLPKPTDLGTLLEMVKRFYPKVT